jgi:hypothetical protein
LPRRGRGTSHDRPNFSECHAEHVVQPESKPLGGEERFEHYQQRETDRIRKQPLVLGVDPVLAAYDRVRHTHKPI